MDSLRDTANNAIGIAKFAGKLAIHGAYMGKRIIPSSFTGICQVCNNLQPTGHERTFGKAELPWGDHPWVNKAELVKIPTLVLEDIPAKDILQARRPDEKTGQLKNDCSYCRLLCEVFDSFFGFETDRWDHYALSGLNLHVGMMIKQGCPLIINCYSFEHDPSVSTSRVDLEMSTVSESFLNMPGAPVMGLAGTRQETSSSRECMQFITDCLQECCSRHPRCQRAENNFVPTRLLFLGDDQGSVRLCESSSVPSNVKWAALSHCWGNGKPLLLVQENLKALKDHIDINVLPDTFRDGITVSRQLGIEFLWIDSLCIIQDSAEDWEREAAMMGKVYSHALLVISGASSGNPNTPFLAPRNEDWLPRRFNFRTATGEIPVNVRRRALLAAPLEQGLHEPPYTTSWGHLKHKGPLYQRGWCFQESHLAHRNIRFSPGAIIFECQTHRRVEDQLPPYTQLYSNILGNLDDGEKWRRMVQVYTARKLTYPKDKLNAIAGISSLLPQAKRTPYLAGLWHESLLWDMLWNAMPGPDSQLRPIAFQLRDQWAPSWSWASVDRAVVWNAFQDMRFLAEIMGAHAKPKAKNSFGEVAAATAVLKARTLKCKIFWRADKASYRAYFMESNGKQSDKKHFISDGALTAQDNSSAGGLRYARRAPMGTSFTTSSLTDVGELDVQFLCLSRTPWQNYNYSGLLIVPSTLMANTWERVGRISNLPSKWYDAGTENIISLV